MGSRDNSLKTPVSQSSNDPSLSHDLPSVVAEAFGLGESSAESPDAASRPQFEEIQDDGLFDSILNEGPPPSSKAARKVRPAQGGKLPNAGDEVFGLRLVRELGRGAFARVFLAHELGLAARPVAAKICFARRDESHTLAQLQHSHIVPIYSAHVDAACGLRVLVMPYFGGTTLDRLLAKAGPQAEQHPTGRGLMTALDHLSLADDGNRRSLDAPVSGEVPVQASRSASLADVNPRELEIQSLRRRLLGRTIPGMVRKTSVPKGSAAQPARQILEKSSYIEAVTWIAARLADGLSHAHQRGIVHRDIKPSNVLIAADGQPMLLDFNLARDLKSKDASAVAYVGGTLPYMAPEHLDAFNTRNPTPASAVDQRSDIYSLGVLLFEMLTNDRPFTVEKPQGSLPLVLQRMAAQRRAGVPSARALNHAVPWSLDAIVRRCLEPQPADRYQDAASLAEDLQCELDSLPLRHTREPSRRERAQKWMRRHPRLSSGGSIATIGVLLISALLYLMLAIGGRLASYDAERRWIKFQEGLIRAQLLVHTGNEPGENVTEGQRVCEQSLGLFGILNNRDWINSSTVNHLEPKVRRRLPDDAIELAILLARTRAEQAKRARAAREQTRLFEEAVGLLSLAEGFPSQSIPRALFEDRSSYRLQLGDVTGADADQARAEAIQAQTARDHYLRGTALAMEKHYEDAVRELKAALRFEPKHFWARFQLGICYYELGQFRSAADAYSVCEAIWLECAWANFNRGLSYSRLDLLQEAIDDYTAAIRKDPRFADAYLNRGLAYLKRQQYSESITDLTHAIDLGCHSAVAALSARATAFAGRRQFDLARIDYDAALRASPGDVSILLSRGFALARHDPLQALADFDGIVLANAQNAQAHYGRAYVLSEFPGRQQAAIDAAHEAVRIDANHLGARCTLAVVLARAGAYDEAIDQIERALAQNDAGFVRYSAACVYALASSTEPEFLDRGFELLESALQQNYGRQSFTSDKDLGALRELQRFDELSARFMAP